MPDINDLSERERQILNLVATGASNKQIADQLFISANTVKVHLRKIFTKIEVTSRTEAALFAVKAGLVETGVTALPNLPQNGEEPPLPVAEDQPELNRAEKITAWIRKHWQVSIGLSAGALLLIVVGIILLRDNQPGVAGANTPTAQVAESRWVEMARMPTARKNLAAAAYEDFIFTIGGETGETVTGAVERYDPSANQWKSVASKPEPVTDAGAAVVRGEIFVPGGKTAAGSPTDRLEIYNPRLDTWRQGVSLPVKLSGYALAAYEGKLYLFGGWDGEKSVSSVYRYSPEDETWAELAPMPSARTYAGAAVAGGKIYVLGGVEAGKPSSVNEAYQPDLEGSGENPWEPRRDIPTPISEMGVASIGNVIHILGGASQPAGRFPAFEYLPQKDEWLPLDSPITQEWVGFGLVPLETKLYLLGGSLDDQLTNKNIAYQAIYTVILPIR